MDVVKTDCVPNAETREAMTEADEIARTRRARFETATAIVELEAGNGERFASVDDLIADLHADD